MDAEDQLQAGRRALEEQRESQGLPKCCTCGAKELPFVSLDADAKLPKSAEVVEAALDQSHADLVSLHDVFHLLRRQVQFLACVVSIHVSGRCGLVREQNSRH